jgi:hypothetical protein
VSESYFKIVLGIVLFEGGKEKTISTPELND